MDTQALIVQTAVALPVILGLVAYTLMRWDRTPLHGMIVALLASIVPWLTGIVLKLTADAEGLRLLGLHLEQLAVLGMAPLFLLTMARFARIEGLLPGRPLFFVVVGAPIALTVAYLSDPWHGLFYADLAAAQDGVHPERWGGPFYWAAQAWCGILSTAGAGCLAYAVGSARSAAERRRALIILGATLVPCLAHLIYVLGWQPFDHSLAPLTLGLTAALFVYGVEAYGVLEGQPIVRSDVIEHLPDALLLADSTLLVLDANSAAEATLGCARRGLRGLGMQEVLGRLVEADEARALAERIVALEPGEGHSGAELAGRDGRVFELTAASVRAEGTHPAGVFVSLRDRTAQRRGERLLRERQKLESVGILAAGVAHEVNNPLAFVRANLAHLQSLAGDLEKAAGPAPGAGSALAEMSEVVEESLEGIERIGRIVEGMLRFSRAPEEAMRPLDLNEVVRESMRLADLHRDRSVTVESVLAPDLPRVQGSADRLVQVMLNLFLNGKQALSGIPEARIVAETAAGDGVALVRVRDNGPGIEREDLARIFDPFFTTRGPDEGTGLGLSIAFDIVREHGGVLEADSEPGRGTCFTIRLPLATG